MIHLKSHSQIVTIIISLLFISCLKENTNNNINGSFYNVTFTIQTPKDDNFETKGLDNKETRGLNNKDENMIKNITVLLFDQNDKLVQLPHYVYQIEETEVDEIKKFTVRIPTGTYNIDLICNADYVVKNSSLFTGMSKTTLFNQLNISREDKWSTDITTDDYLIPMWGGIKNKQIDQDISLNIKLIRMLVKVNLILYGNAAIIFKLNQFVVIEYNTVGRIAPFSSSLDNPDDYNKVIDVSLPSNPTPGTSTLVYEYPEVEKTYCINEVYLFEVSKDAPQQVVTIIVGTKNGDLKIYVLPFKKNIGDVPTDLSILRNHSYLFLIDDIIGDGYNSIEEAITAIRTTRSDNISNISYKIIEKEVVYGDELGDIQ